MKRYIKATTPLEYNQKQTEVGLPLKTLKGSRIARSKYGVGKEIGGSIYVHKNYMEDVVPSETLDSALSVLESKYPDFQYNCIKYDKNTNTISFQEVPDFDTAREPKVGDYIIVKPDGSTRTGHSDYIFHHKWLFVRNNYTGFDVTRSWDWSKEWLSVLQEPSDGNGIDRWNNQLKKYKLPIDANEVINMRQSILGAEVQDAEEIGTTFYVITEDALKNAYEHESNIVMQYLVQEGGFSIFDTSKLYGSEQLGSDFILCVTDGYDIDVLGEDVDPESALEDFDLDILDEAGYVDDNPDDTVIKRFFSKYELASSVDIDDAALELLNAGHHLYQIVEDAQELELL